MNITTSFFKKNNPKTGEGFYPKNNIKLESRDLKSVFLSQNNMNPNAPKHADGCIFPFNWDKNYPIDDARKEGMMSNGTLFLDLDTTQKDHTTEKYSEEQKLFDFLQSNMEKINEKIGWCILGSSRSKNGIHIIFLSSLQGGLLESEHKWMAALYTALFQHAVKSLYDIDIEAYIDTHNFKLSQQLFLRYSNVPVYWIDGAAAPFAFTSDWVNMLKEKYPYVSKQESKLKVQDCDVFENIDVKNVKFNGKFKITHSFNNTGWWRVCGSLRNAFGDEEARSLFKQFCIELEAWNHLNRPAEDKGHSAEWMFKNAWTSQVAKLDPKLLQDIGVDFELNIQNKEVEERESVHSLGYNDWMMMHEKEILDFWDEKKVCMLVGTTGLGKTELIKKISNDRKVMVLVPYNDMLGIYAKDTEWVQGVPDVIVAGKSSKYSGENSVCLVWDQVKNTNVCMEWNRAKRVFERRTDKDFAIIVDESHLLQSSTTFRTSAVDTINYLKSFIQQGGNVMFVTATPTIEKDAFGIDDDSVMLYDRKGSYIRPVEIIHSWNNEKGRDTADWKILGDVVGGYKRGWFNHICVWSDLYNMRLADHCRAKGIRVHQISKRAADKNPECKFDLEYLKKTEMLQNGVYLLTKLTENGFNFKNNTGTALIIIGVREEEFSYDKIIQIIGRFRYIPFLKVRVYVESRSERELSLKERHEKAKLYSMSDIHLNANDHLEREDVYEEMLRNEEYEKMHGNPVSLKEDLENYMGGGKFSVVDTDLSEEENKCMRLSGKVKKNEENAVYENRLRKGDVNLYGSVYADELTIKFVKLVSNYGFDNVVKMIDKLLELSEKKSGETKNISTIVDEIDRYVEWVLESEEWVEKQSAMIEAACKVLGSDKLVSSIMKDLNRAKNWRDKFGALEEWDSWIQNFCIVVDEDICLTAESVSLAHSKPHKEHKKQLLRVVEDGFEGTRDEVAEHIGKNKDTVTRWLKIGKAVKI